MRLVGGWMGSAGGSGPLGCCTLASSRVSCEAGWPAAAKVGSPGPPTSLSKCLNSRACVRAVQAYKYVPFGAVDEVLPYLVRRAQENSDMLGGVGQETAMLRTELKRRLLGGN